MGQCIDGVWHAGWYEPNAKGAFERPATKFRARVGEGPFAVEAGRYHLYAAHACPWAHRTLITRALRGLEEAISVTLVDTKMGDDGWPFQADDPDPIFGAAFLREIYVAANAKYTGRVTVPVLWDKKTATIVSNESREIMRMFDTAFEPLAKPGTTLAPAALVPAIDAALDAIYEPINNGVYKAGFATKQGAYEDACATLFRELDRWDTTLGTQRFVCGDTMTEADVALFTTLLRFDLVYYAHFKCNLRALRDYEHLWGFVRDVYRMPAVKKTINLDAIKTHYYWSQTTVNPHRVVPLGPNLVPALEAPVAREHLGKATK